MKNDKIENAQGHWILAKMGKRVLRPGGLELTEKLINQLNISNNDCVVEFAPGLGGTAMMTLSKQPKTYTGVEINEDVASTLRKKINGEGREIIIGNASDSTLPSNQFDKVYGEAMLTMQSPNQKVTIIKEANRLLKTGGLYGIHELELTPDSVDESIKNDIYKALSRSIKVSARPLTKAEWTLLLEENGFKVIANETSPMHLLEPKRVLRDEGLLRTLKIMFNVLTHPKEKKRIMMMRRTFRSHKDNLSAIALIAEKL